MRLEDTDQTRVVPKAAEQSMLDLRALGLDWEFGPDKPHPQFGSCIQSERLEVYREFIEKLLKADLAYHDYTTPEQLQNLREEAQKQKKAFIFRRNMACLKPTKKAQKPVVRIAIPENLTIAWEDVVKGEQSWQSEDIGDFVALKSDGWPTYHLANVIDDYLMQISHVIRADEWLSSTPKHLYLFDCLNLPRPQYVHVPPVLAAEGGQKLSKRDQGGRVAELLKEGYTKAALLNYLSLLGWNPKTSQEIFTVEELIEAFDIAKIQVSGSRFDAIRLDWFNGQHIRTLAVDELQAEAEAWWPKDISEVSKDYKNRVLGLVYQRIKKWSELTELTDFFFQKPKMPDLETLIKETKLSKEEIETLTEKTLQILEEINFSAGDLELHLYQTAQTQKISPSKYFTLLRLKLTGKKIAPGLFETMDVLGLEECRQRLSGNNIPTNEAVVL